MKITLPSVAGGYNLQLINENFQTIAQELNGKVLYRANPSGEPNSLASDIDMNGKRIYNLIDPVNPSEPVTLGWANTHLATGANAEIVALVAQVEADKVLVEELAMTATLQAGIAITQAGLAITAAGEVAAGVGTGTVTTLSVASANGFAGSVATPTTTPVVTLTTPLTGLLKGTGTGLAAAVSGTDIKTIGGISLIGSGDIAVGGSGTVTSASVVSANGMGGTVATATTTPAITFTTSVTGIVKGNGTAFSAATAGTDYTSPSSTETMTNKRITVRVGSTTSSATPTINTNNVDVYKLTAQAVDITSFTTNLTGTPTDNQCLIIEITGTAARAITWGASFEASTVALPTTTVTTAMLAVAFLWNTATSKWRCIAAV